MSAIHTRSETLARLAMLYNPRSIAVIGASQKPGKRGYAAIENLCRLGYQGQIFPINPRYDEVAGLPCYASITDVPGAVEAAAICLPGAAAVDALEQCAQVGVRAAGVVANGFAEASPAGAALQERLIAIARRYGMAVSGPNCLGIADRTTGVSYWLKLPLTDARSGIGAVIQSGALAHGIMDPAVERGLSIDVLATTGNEAVVTASDHLAYLVDHSAVRVIVALLEGFRDPGGFVRVAGEALRRGKPIIMLKVGRSEGGRRAAAAHTASLATPDAVVDAVFERLGIIRVDDLDELIETMALFAGTEPRRGERVMVATVSGAGCGMLADLADQIGLPLPAPSPVTAERLAAELPDIGIGNPLDIALAGDVQGVYRRCINILAESGEYDLLSVVLNCPRSPEEWGKRFYQDQTEAAVSFASAGEGRSLVSSFASGAHDLSVLEIARAGRIPVLQGARETLLAIKRLLEYQSSRARWLDEMGEAEGPCRDAVPLPRQGGLLSERDSRFVLERYGVPFVRALPATTAAEAVNAADALGYSVAIKVDSPDLPHKSDVGGVELNVADAAEVRAAYVRVVDNARQVTPTAQITGVIVQEMAPPGRELIVGIKRDEQFGPIILVGIGGVFVEVLRDFALGVPPISAPRAHAMLRALRGYPLLEGVRGGEPADLDAVVEVIQALSRFAVDHSTSLDSADINPLIIGARGEGAVAVDALVALRQSTGPTQDISPEETP